MKKTIISLICPFFFLLNLCSNHLTAQCTIPITQTGANSVVTDQTVGQSWLADCDGFLQSITVTSGSGTLDATGVTLNVWKQNGLNLDLIFSQSGITVAGNGASTTVATPNVAITAPSALPLDLGVYFFTFSASAPNTITLKAQQTLLGDAYLSGVVVTNHLNVLGNPILVSDLVQDVTSDLTFIITGSSVVLPIDLISFKAAKLGHQSQLYWVTASETDNQYFAIERSRDGKTFKEIGRVQGYSASSAKQDYNFIDPLPDKGDNYYRLKQVNLNGKFSYSNIENVVLSEAADVTVYPNPTKGRMTIETSTFGKNEVTIVDYMGRALTSKTFANNVTEIDINALPNGIYFVECKLDGILVRKKIVKD